MVSVLRSRREPVDFTGGSATIQIIDPTTHPSGYELFLKLYDQTDNSLYYQANLAGSTMLFTRSFSSKQMSNSFPFDPSLHRWWRVSHRAGTTIVLQTSVDGVVYTDQLMFLANPIPLTQIRLEIGSGTYMPLVELALSSTTSCSAPRCKRTSRWDLTLWWAHGKRPSVWFVQA